MAGIPLILILTSAHYFLVPTPNTYTPELV